MKKRKTWVVAADPAPTPDVCAVDEDARWIEICKISDEIAHGDTSPSKVESALCGAVWRAKEARAQIAGLEAELAAQKESAAVHTPMTGSATPPVDAPSADPAPTPEIASWLPETDAFHNQWYSYGYPQEAMDFASTLEYQRDEARAQVASLTAEVAALKAELAADRIKASDYLDEIERRRGHE